MPSRLVLLDNTVLTNFALVYRADLVLDLWGEAGATTQAVMAEYQAGVTARDLAAKAWEDLTVLGYRRLKEHSPIHCRPPGARPGGRGYAG